MNDVETLLALARKRAAERNLPYAGALLPKEAYALLKANDGAVLIDVRTQAEHYWVGKVPGTASVEWTFYPGGARNPDFLTQLKAVAPDTSKPVMFLCRSGVRSHNAATLAASVGYTHSLNILEGFEGDRDPQGHRNTVGGWRAAGLPWEQS